MYDYETEKKNIFTDEGQRMFLKIRDTVHRLLEVSGAFQMEKAWKNVTGSSWEMMACVDRLAELGEIQEVGTAKSMAQYRVFIKG